MSQTLSPSLARCYGMARVTRVWKMSRASVYRSLKETPPNTIAGRPGPVGACSDAELAEHIRQHIAASRLHGEGYRNAVALCWRSHQRPLCATGDARERPARAASRWTHRDQAARWDDHHRQGQ